MISLNFGNQKSTFYSFLFVTKSEENNLGQINHWVCRNQDSQSSNMCCSHYYNINEINQESLKIVVSTVFLFCLVSYLVIENLAFLSKIKAHTWEN